MKINYQKPAPKILVLLASFNGERFVYSQLKSIINQQGVDVSILISDHCSTDKTLKLIKDIFLKESFKNYKIISNKNKLYKSAAENFYYAIKNVSNFKNYDYVSFADQDDLWISNKLIKGISIIQNNCYDAYSSSFNALWKSGKLTYHKKSYAKTKYDFFFESAGPGCTYIMTSKLVNNFKRFIKSNNFYFPHHDWFIYAYARQNNFRWFIDNESYIHYRQHDNNDLGVNYGLQAYKKRLISLISCDWIYKCYKLCYLFNNKKFKSYDYFKKFFIFNFFTTRRYFLHKIIVLFVIIICYFKKCQK